MRKAKILITFDDGIYNQKYALDYINSLGMCGVVGVVANKIDKNGFLSKKDLIELQVKGNTIINHSFDHEMITGFSNPNLKEHSFEEVYDSFLKAKEILNNMGFNGNYFMLPFGTRNTGNWENLKKLGEISDWIRCTVGHWYKNKWEFDTNKRIYPNNYKNKYIGITCPADLRFPKEVEQKVDEAVYTKGICVLCYHDVCHVVGEGQNITWNRFCSDMDYISNKIKEGVLENIRIEDIR